MAEAARPRPACRMFTGSFSIGFDMGVHPMSSVRQADSMRVAAIEELASALGIMPHELGVSKYEEPILWGPPRDAD